jgi:hypothetical protein
MKPISPFGVALMYLHHQSSTNFNGCLLAAKKSLNERKISAKVLKVVYLLGLIHLYGELSYIIMRLKCHIRRTTLFYLMYEFYVRLEKDSKCGQ